MAKSEGLQLSVDDIVEAATEIFVEQGLDAVTTEEIEELFELLIDYPIEGIARGSTTESPSPGYRG